MLKSDGNGGYIIQKGTFTLIMCLIALISCVGTVVGYGATIRSDVSHLQEAIEFASIEHPKYQKDTNDKLSEHERSIIINQQQIIAMDNNIEEIKNYLKELLPK